MKRIFYIIYIVVAIIFLIALYSKNQLICDITKPIPLILLVILIKWDTPYSRLISFGLIFSIIGDIILESFKLFVPGLIAFLIAHVFYIFAFLKKSNKVSIISSIPFFAYGVLLFLILYKSLGAMALPVLVYMFVICTMLWRSFVQRNSGKLSNWAFLGAIFFTISDSLIAVSKFYHDFYLAPLLVMTTYWVAQFLIYWSAADLKKN